MSAISVPPAHPARRAQTVRAGADVIYVFSAVTWRAAQRRGLGASEDRLVLTLLGHEAVDRLLVCEHFRSAPRLLAQRLLDRGEPFPVSQRAALCSPMRVRRHDPTAIAAVERTCAAYERRMRRAAARMGMRRPAIIVGNPALAGFGRFDWAGPVTFYAIDDWTAYTPDRAWWPAYRAAFERVRERGRRVVAVSPEIVERIAPTGPALVVPNGVDPGEWLAAAAAPAWFRAAPAPRLLYVGTLDARLDAGLVEAAARVAPHGSMTLVGPQLDDALLGRLRALPNVRVHASVGRREVVALVSAADACLIPHARTPLTEAMSPLKLYEYLAGGRPVAAVDLPPIARAGHPRVALADARPDAFAAAVRRALALGAAPADERLRFLRDNSWRRRHEPLLELALA